MKLTDEQLLAAITRYRDDTGGRHSPPSLDALAEYLCAQGVTAHPRSRSALSVRIRRLVAAGRLAAGQAPDGKIQTFSLAANKPQPEV